MSLIVVLHNISNLADVSDYDYQVFIGDGSVYGSKLLESGKVRGHARAAGWPVLLRQLLAQRVETEE